jgi:DNA mismatch endonuclease (patch repair protein)
MIGQKGGATPMSEPRKPPPARTARDTSAIMRCVRGRDTAPELLLRRALHARGLRYRVCVADLPGKPDIVFATRRLAVFIDGDYWHGGQWETRGLRQLEQQFARTKDPTYWLRKIRRTMARDCAATAALLAAGWTVLRFWESDVRGALDRCVEMTSAVLASGAEARAPSVLAAKTVAPFHSDGAHTPFDSEAYGWRPLLDDANDRLHVRRDDGADSPAPPATLAVASCAPGGCQRVVAGLRTLGPRLPPLALLALDADTLLISGGADDLALALLALNGLGYTVDAFVLDDPRLPPHPRRGLFVVGVQATLTQPRTLRERRSAYMARSEASDLRPDDLIAFTRTHPEIAWSLRDLPTSSLNGDDVERQVPDMDGEATESASVWIATNYLDPVVNELLRGRPLYPARARPRSRSRR